MFVQKLKEKKLVDKTVSFQIRDKKVNDSVRLVLTYHPALNQLYKILCRAHRHVLKSPRLYSALASPLRVVLKVGCSEIAM